MADQQHTIEILPLDEHNSSLLGNVHPENWVNPDPADSYNLVVIGGGTAGLVSAAGAAALGARVALVERNFMGGDCLNTGCVPSKGLIRAARAAADVRDAGKFGVEVPQGVTASFPAAMDRMRKLRAQISANDSVARFADLGVDIFLGHGRFSGRRTVEVDGKKLHFAKAAIATGARASAPPIPGLEETGYLTNETVFNLTELPERIAIIGAGPIGCEMAQSFARFGSKVYLVELFDQILAKEPGHIAEIVERSLLNDGVEIRKSAKTERLERIGSESMIHVESAGSKETLAVDAVLVSVGRKPNIEDLGLDIAGVAYDPAGVSVNEYLQTTNHRIYAAGDISSTHKFTHTADALAAIVIQNSLFARTKKADALIVPWCTYTDPEVAHVGDYPGDAASKGIETKTYAAHFSDNDRAILDGDADFGGLAEIYTKKGSDKIVGATVVAKHAGDMISEITLAMQSGTGLSALTSVIHPYPTQADIIRKAAREYMKSRLTPKVKRMMERWMSWHR